MSLDMEMLKRFSYGNSIDSIFECDKVDYILIGANCVRPNAILYEKRIAREITMVEHDRRSDMQHKKKMRKAGKWYKYDQISYHVAQFYP